MTKNPEDDQPVGYGQPPVHSRFQKGRSGNPGGRPRSKVSSVLSKVMDQQVDLKSGGTCTRLELLMTTLAVHAQSEEPYMRLLLTQLDKIDRRASTTEETADDESGDDQSGESE